MHSSDQFGAIRHVFLRWQTLLVLDAPRHLYRSVLDWGKVSGRVNDGIIAQVVAANEFEGKAFDFLSKTPHKFRG